MLLKSAIGHYYGIDWNKVKTKDEVIRIFTEQNEVKLQNIVTLLFRYLHFLALR